MTVAQAEMVPEEIVDRRRALLAVSCMPVWPLRDGFALRACNLLECLREQWDITLVAPMLPDSNAPAWLADLDWVDVAIEGSWRLHPGQYDSRPLVAAVKQVLERMRPDAVLLWVGTEFLALELPQLRNAAADRVDCSLLAFLRDVGVSRSLRQLVNCAQSSVEMALYERRMTRALRATIVVGDDDAATLRRISRRDTVHVIPNGVRIPGAPDYSLESDVPTVVFTGVMNYGPNVDAALFFARHVWPLVVAEVPEAKYVIAGRMPTQDVLALASEPGIEVAGEVPSITDTLKRAWLATAPMQSGTGIKNKVLEAWACAKPVLMSRMAANGLTVEDWCRPLIADRPEQLAALTVELFRDTRRRRQLGLHAHALVSKKFTWSAAANAFSDVLREVSDIASVHPQRPASLPNARR